MKSIRLITIITCAFFIVHCDAQQLSKSSNSTASVPLHVVGVYDYSILNKRDKIFNYRISTSWENNLDLTLYNPTTRLFDSYLINGSSPVMPYPKILFESKTSDLGNDLIDLFIPRPYIISQEYSTFPLRDSFNPHGTRNIKDALLAGFIGTLFKNN